MSKKSRRNSIRSHSLQTPRKFYSDGRDLRENLQRRAQQAILGGQGDGVPRHAKNRRRRARQRPEPACVQTPLIAGWHTQGEKGELTSCRGTVQSAWQRPPVGRTRGKARLPARVSGDHVVRGRRSSPIPAQASRVSVAVRGAPR